MGIRGISLEINQKDPCILKGLLAPVCLERFVWFCPAWQEEVWSRPSGTLFFTQECYTGEELNALVEVDHFVVFLRLEAYFSKIVNSEIETYADFKESSCQMILLISDCENVEFYIKDKNLLKNCLEEFSKNKKYKSIEYITDENDSRTRMFF